MTKLEREIADLERRKAQLQRLVQLRDEVFMLETQAALKSSQKRKLAEDCIRLICREYEVGIKELLSRCRAGNVVLARWLLFSIMAKRLKMTQVQIAEYCKVNHSTVSYAMTRYEDLLAYNKAVREKAESVTKLLNESVLNNPN